MFSWFTWRRRVEEKLDCQEEFSEHLGDQISAIYSGKVPILDSLDYRLKEIEKLMTIITDTQGYYVTYSGVCAERGLPQGAQLVGELDHKRYYYKQKQQGNQCQKSCTKK